MTKEFLWISEADVVSMMDMGDATEALEAGLLSEARGDAENMNKTHVAWSGNTLHAIGATFPREQFVGTKTWAHTEGGATPLLILYDSTNGSLQAVIEAMALGQLRTGAASAVATRWLAAETADELAIAGTGRQALAQVAAVAAVRPLRRVRIYGRNEERRQQLATRVREELGIDAEEFRAVADAVRGAPIITTVTRAKEPFLTAAMVAPGTHINAVGAIVPSGAELAEDLMGRCSRIVVDSVAQSQKLSRELMDFFGSDPAKWNGVQSLAAVVAAPRWRHPTEEITLFKSLGMGIADLALGMELYRKAVERGLGRSLPHPTKAAPRLRRGAAAAAPRAFTFVDRSGSSEPLHRPYEPVVITREDIEAEVERLASLPRPANGRRVSVIHNPASGVGQGLAPGTAVSLCVLKPGERTKPVRHNVSLINFCVRGRGTSIVDDKRIDFSQYDAFNIPPWSVYQYINESDDIQVRLTYSNSALLEKLNIHVVDEEPRPVNHQEEAEEDPDNQPNPFGTMRLTDEGAYVMPYEKLINPDVVKMEALHWPWKKVKAELDKLTALGKSYVGRRLYLLYNPATGRTNGTSHTFFATICVRPANIVDKPHRHTASAINYFFKGSGWSIVGGKRYTWKAGDLMLTAPGWAVHNHASNDEDVYELTIQDSPLQIAMGSLLWQEDLTNPPQVLGTTGGFATNRAAQEVGRR